MLVLENIDKFGKVWEKKEMEMCVDLGRSFV